MSYPYLVSIRLMVYNHESYIRETIDGILKQKTNFIVEVVIGDDFSTDKSLEIIREYQSTSTIHFKILERNVGDDYWQNRQMRGRLHNFYNIIENCTGKYIALLDGDDYWTDPYKLQKQVDFLEANTDFSVCFHKVSVLNMLDETQNHVSNQNQKSVLDIFDLALNGNFIHTVSVVYRKSKKKIPEWLLELPIGDYPLHLFNAQFGKIKFLDELMGTYRIHENGVWGSFSQEKIYDKWINILDFLEKKFNLEVNRLLSIQKMNRLFEMYMMAYKMKNEGKGSFIVNKLSQMDSFYLAKKLKITENRLEKILNSKSYKIGNVIIIFFITPFKIFRTIKLKLLMKINNKNGSC